MDEKFKLREIIALPSWVDAYFILSDDVEFEQISEEEDYEHYFDEDGEYLRNNPLWEDFEYVTQYTNHYDLEDGYASITSIVRRISDGKFFSGKHDYGTYYSYGEEYDYLTLTEVFPEQITKTYYN